jgi:energy-coupling factor transport system ATP-binding protein
VTRSLDAVGLSGFERKEPHLLSGGQKQRLAIAGALALDPLYLVLDEIKTMLDPEGRDDVDSVISDLRDEGRGILLITHDLDDLVLADRVGVMSKGALVFDGTRDEFPKDPAILQEWGLAPTSLGVLAEELERLGADVPSYGTAGEVATALWR